MEATGFSPLEADETCEGLAKYERTGRDCFCDLLLPGMQEQKKVWVGTGD